MSRPRWRSTLALLTLLAVGFALPALAHSPASSTGQAASQSARGEQLTLDLVRLNVQYQAAPQAQRPQLEQRLLGAALAREQELLALMESDPGEVLRLAVPPAVRASMPAAVQAHVEEHTVLEGTIEVLHEDNVAGDRYHYHLDTGGGRFTLYFAADAPDNVLTGSRVRAHGVRVNQTLALEGSGSIQLVTTALPNTFGAQKTLVILVNFTDKATQPYTVDYARSVVFTTTGGFDLENSFGQTWLVGDVVGWYTIPMSSTVCDYNTLATHAKQAATAAGVNVAGYTRHVFAFPNNACTWWGLGSVGGNPSRAWINGSFQLRVVGHEMGHNFGLYHSHSYDCGSVVLGGSCTSSDYGDTLDIMGSSSGHFNAFQKERLGWLNYGSSPPLYTVTTTGTYTIEPYETQTWNPKGIKLVQSVNPSTGKKTWYYLEYRQGIGYDGFVTNNANVKSGVVLHLGTEGSGNSSYLLDMTPATSSWSDPALVVGQSYYDGATGVTITPLWADAGGAGVSVAFGALACVRGAPTVALSPSQSQWLPAGAIATFTASVTNNDNQGCSASTFSLQGAVPSGWSGTLGASSIALAPGASGSTTFGVTSPASATDGFYPVNLNANDAAVGGHAGSASATYVVMAKLDTAVSTDRSTYSRPGSVWITTRVSANGSPVAGASVTVNVTKSNGATTKLTGTTDASGLATVKLSLKKPDPTGVYQAVATATMSGGATGQAATTFVVQ